MSINTSHHTAVKRTLWTVTVFYLLITLEFLYMASPFALYFYSAYLPGLDFISSLPALAWLSQVYLPHIVTETSSTLINLHNVVGGFLFSTGLLTFIICAVQVYYDKLTRKNAVTRGIYRFIRHPQYVALAVCGLGMLLIWPRFIVLVSYVTMLFAYYILARVEEKECVQKFGKTYEIYQDKTHMFLPFRIPLIDRLPGLPSSGMKRVLAMVTMYIVVLAVTLASANGVRNRVVHKLYGFYDTNAAYISVGKTDEDTLRQIARIALTRPEVRMRLEQMGAETKYINYILPTTWYVSEIPMNPISSGTGHHHPKDYDHNQYKIVFTQVISSINQKATGQNILFTAIKRVPVVEVWVNLEQMQVTDIMEPPDTIRYEHVPVPIY